MMQDPEACFSKETAERVVVIKPVKRDISSESQRRHYNTSIKYLWNNTAAFHRAELFIDQLPNYRTVTLLKLETLYCYMLDYKTVVSTKFKIIQQFNIGISNLEIILNGYDHSKWLLNFKYFHFLEKKSQKNHLSIFLGKYSWKNKNTHTHGRKFFRGRLFFHGKYSNNFFKTF